MNVPSTLPEFLAWIVGGGAGALANLIIAKVFPIFPRIEEWWIGRSPVQKQAVTMLLSLALVLLALGGQFWFDLAPVPVDKLAWASFVFTYLILPLLSGLAFRMVFTVTPNEQVLWRIRHRS